MYWLVFILCVIETCKSFAQQSISFPKNCHELNYLPMPKVIKCKFQDAKLYPISNPCRIEYNLFLNQSVKEVPSYIAELIEHQQRKTFGCRYTNINIKRDKNHKFKQKQDVYFVDIQLKNHQLKSAFTTKQQSYYLKIKKQIANLKTDHYVGLVRGLQTFLQSINCDKKCKNCYMQALPIEIQDEPMLVYRGFLVDTSRHFLGLNTLKETVDAMMYNKMNVFHWHITDQDSFPLQLTSHPEIAQYGSFSVYQRFTVEDVKDFINYAMIRGVRVIPEIDTPGHAASWGRAPQNYDIACAFNQSSHQGPLDVTMDQTYKVVKQVFKEIFQLFPDPYVHLGGDQVQLKCLKNMTEFIRLQGLPNNASKKDIEFTYRRKQKKMLRQLNSSKIFIYWMHNLVTQIGDDDVIHHWGNLQVVPEQSQVKNHKFIISKSTFEFYIDMGTGGIRGNFYHNYSTWLDIHSLNLAKQLANSTIAKNALGIELTLWAETNSIYTHHLKMWIRSSAMAERAWNEKQFGSKPNFFKRMLHHQKLMNRRGIPTAPATSQQCELHPQFCQKS